MGFALGYWVRDEHSDDLNEVALLLTTKDTKNTKGMKIEYHTLSNLVIVL